MTAENTTAENLTVKNTTDENTTTKSANTENTTTKSTTTENTTASIPADSVPVYRMYNYITSEHLQTTDAGEYENLINYDWNQEGVCFLSPAQANDLTIPVYRLYNEELGTHHYTTDITECDNLTQNWGWTYDNNSNPMFYSLPITMQSASPVYRLYNPDLSQHHYTMDKTEVDNLIANFGWEDEGVGYYNYKQATSELKVSVNVLGATANTASNATINEQTANNSHYIFLPSYANLSDVVFTFSNANGDAISSVTLSVAGSAQTTITSGTSINLSALGIDGKTTKKLTFTCTTDSTSALTKELYILQSSNINTIFITSIDAENYGRAYIEADPNHNTSANVNILAVSATGEIIYEGTENADTIKGRGNTTWSHHGKRPYQIKLNKKTDLLCSGNSDNKAKKWLLLANAGDCTLLRNTICLNTGLELGLGKTTENTPCDLVYDGEFRGSYLLCEKVEAGQGRIDIDNLDDANEKVNAGADFKNLATAQSKNKYGNTMQYVTGVKSPENITGGYIIENDTAFGKGETSWFEAYTTRDDVFSLRSPEAATKNEVTYVSELFEEGLQALKNNGTNAQTGKTISDYFDIDSLVKTLLINEFYKNCDAFYSSTYFVKNANDDKFYCYPIWDADATCGNRTNNDECGAGFTYWGYYCSNNGIGKLITSVPALRERIVEIYKSELSPLIKNTVLGDTNTEGTYVKSINANVNIIRASEKIDCTIYGLTRFPNNLTPLSTWSENVEAMRNFIAWRTNWFDSVIERCNVTDFTTENFKPVHDDVDYSVVFDAIYYREHNKTQTANCTTDSELFNHFITYGMGSGLQASANFNVQAYRANNPAIVAECGNDLQRCYAHYCTTGFSQGLKSL